MLKGRKKREMIYFLLPIIVILGAVIIQFIVTTRTPVKYAVRLEDIYQYPDSILVQQTWHTGTGWEIVGNENGLYENPIAIADVQLEGNLPPGVGMIGEGIDHVNVYLCIVTLTGTFRIEGTTSPIHEYEKFEVIDWYPIYPVKRDTLLPSWFYPQEYLAKSDNIQ